MLNEQNGTSTTVTGDLSGSGQIQVGKPGSTEKSFLPHSSVEIHMVHKMPSRKGTIGFARLQYEATDGVMAIVRKMGGMWVYMNGKYFPSKGRTAHNEKKLMDAGIVAVFSERSKLTVLMTKAELKKLNEGQE